MEKLVLGILAHVDAGKTTLSESILYLSGKIRKLGRVDYGNAFLDTHELERARGITIFSKQAVFPLGERQITLLDTPGHVDFSAEMERTLQVLDYAILVINGADGVQGHTQTLWRLLTRYRIPTFLFVNKMDQEGTDKETLLAQLQKKLSGNCVDFSGSQDDEAFLENLAVCDELILEQYLETGEIETEQIAALIQERKLFPCYFGSALKLTGVEEFLRGLDMYMKMPKYRTMQKDKNSQKTQKNQKYQNIQEIPKGQENQKNRENPDTFGAKVFKIARDEQGNRMTYMKITKGSLKVKTILTNRRESAETEGRGGSEEVWEEKVDQIRIYSGARYEAVNEADVGSVCAVTGLTKTYPGEGLGVEPASELPVLEPVLTYQIILPEEMDAHTMLLKLRQLEEEEPQLHIVWMEQVGEIHAQLMGEVQIEVLKALILERFGVAVEFGAGNIVYKETITAPVEGVGHFEPLRHYAEVHLLMEPAERGSGMQFSSTVSEDVLDRNWQRLILTHLEEREHVGVLTGSVITDMHITLVAGRAHLKHTEGGDFRQATYRAVRQGLMKARNILLEPYYEFQLEIPTEMLGRALTDIQRMSGSFQPPVTEGEMSILTGKAPVSEMRGYPLEVTAYSRGRGRLTCTLKGYEPCHNAQEVIEQTSYDAELDFENPTGSVFCSHGAGFVVSWDQVEDYMHLEGLKLEKQESEIAMRTGETDTGKTDTGWMGAGNGFLGTAGTAGSGQRTSNISTGGRTNSGKSSDFGREDRELEEIFIRTYGAAKKEKTMPARTILSRKAEEERRTWQKPEPVDEYLLVDGYNIIFSWDELKEMAETNIDGARSRLMDVLCNYQGFKKCKLILVFDAYKVKGHVREVVKYHNIYVVYTKEAETADQYIEKVVHEIGRKYHVTVATSDGLEQVIIFGQGAARLSARGLKEEVELVNRQIREEHLDKQKKTHNYLAEYLKEEEQDKEKQNEERNK